MIVVDLSNEEEERCADCGAELQFGQGGECRHEEYESDFSPRKHRTCLGFLCARCFDDHEVAHFKADERARREAAHDAAVDRALDEWKEEKRR